MHNPQEETLAAYNNNVELYKAHTISIPSTLLIHRIDKTLHGLAADSKILEVGSGTGRDADYMESLGYTIIRSDAAANFVLYNREKGKHAIAYNILTDTLDATYDLIFANAVLLHFTHEQCKAIFTHRKERITADGKISWCVQQGEGSMVKENKGMKRYFYYRTEEQVQDIMHQTGYNHIDTRVDEPEPGKKWIRCIASL